MKTSMRDVAKAAGVSTATVSHVINNTRPVAEATKQKVLDRIEALGYVPDQIGRMFKTGKKNLVGFIVPDIANPVWALIIEEVESVLSVYGVKLIIVNTKETESREIENIQLLVSGIVDGLILASTLAEFEQIRRIVPEGFPMVFIDRQLAGCPCDTIIPQDYNAIYTGVKNYIVEGHKRIGFVTGLMRISTSQARLAAYEKAMADYGLPVEKGFIQEGNSLAKSAVHLMQGLLDAECTAIVVSNNVMAGDALYFFTQKGIRIGEDILLLGQGVEGDSDYHSRKMDLLIQPSKEIGRSAGHQILERIESPDAPIKNIVLYSSLIRRLQ